MAGFNTAIDHLTWSDTLHQPAVQAQPFLRKPNGDEAASPFGHSVDNLYAAAAP